MTGTMTYTWEEAEMGLGLGPNARDWRVDLEVDYYATKHIPAKVNCDPEDGHPAEGGELLVESVRVVSIEHAGRTVDVTAAHNSYWVTRFELEMQDSDDFREELIQAVDDDTAEFED